MKKSDQILIEKYLSDDCSESELEVILSKIKSDGDFKQEILETQRLKGLIDLSQENAPVEHLADQVLDAVDEFMPDRFEQEIMDSIKDSPRPRRFKWYIAAAVALHVLLISLGIYFASSSPVENKVIATVKSKNDDAYIMRAGEKINISKIKEIISGDNIHTGASGDLTLTYPDSTTVRVSSGTAITAYTENNAKRIELLMGKIYGNVVKQTETMQISTSNSLIEILGTRFIVSSDSITTVLDVIEGRVKITEKSTQISKTVKDNGYAIVDAKEGNSFQSGKQSNPSFISRTVTAQNRGNPVDIKVDISGAKKLYLIVDDVDETNFFDHGLWLNPILKGPKGILKLTDLKPVISETSYKRIEFNKNIENRSETLYKGQKLSNFIYAHAISILVFDLPPGYTSFEAKGLIPDNLAKLDEYTPSLKFKVFTKMPIYKQKKLLMRIRQSYQK